MFRNIPEKVEYILNRLRDEGYEAYAVGGCVRDTLLSKEPKDWDITTSAEPEQTKELFRRTVDTGIKHGTVTVLLGDDSFEVTTYRIDGEYEDSRHPKNVTFTKCLSEDLLRRDFTINAMAYNPKEGIVDLFGGQKDLENKLIRCVGNPFDRFSEDALRILRAFRFSARLGFEIEPETERAARELAPTLSKISVERIREEISKLLTSPRPEGFEKLEKSGVLKIILPELSGVFVDESRTREILSGIERTLSKAALSDHDATAFAWAVVIAAATSLKKDDAKQFARDVMWKLKFDTESVRLTAQIVSQSREPLPQTEEEVRRSMSLLSENIFKMWLLYLEETRLYDVEKPSECELDRIRALSDRVLASGCCLSLKELAVSGRDLMGAGLSGGAKLGRCLDYLLDRVLEKPENNNKETLLKLAGEYYDSCETA